MVRRGTHPTRLPLGLGRSRPHRSLREAWGNRLTGMDYADGDLDLDGDVDVADLATLLGVYGDACP